MSSLFKLASQAARRAAESRFGTMPLIRGIGSVFSRRPGASFRRAMRAPRQHVIRAVQDMAADQQRRLQPSSRTGEPTPPPVQRSRATRDLLKLTGDIGEMTSIDDRQADQLVDRITNLIRDARSDPTVTTEQKDALAEIAEILTQRFAPPAPPPPPPTAPTAEEWPEEHDIQLLGRGHLGYDAEGTERLLAREIRTPQSSNVYSFVYQQENTRGPLRMQTGILYVTFRLWHPGMKGKRPNQPGPTYAYYDVPASKYKEFQSAASTGSAGGAVWDYLRQRGSQFGHQHPYRLVAGALVPHGGEYVPRKATKWGYRKRALPAFGTGRRGFQRSQLPEQRWDQVNRGRPNRGRPNTGRP